MMKTQLTNAISKINVSSHKLLYAAIGCFGILFLWLSFIAKGNWVNVLCGVGTGLITSLIVSIIINYDNDKRLQKKLEIDKRYLLNDIVYYSKDVYEDIIYRINEYIMFCDKSMKSVYKAYEDFSSVNEFCNTIESIDLSQLNEEQRSSLETLLNIGNYGIDFLVSELKRIPKQEYYLRGILTKEECDMLSNPLTNDRYIQYAANLEEFWKDEIIDLKTCVLFMKMTLYIATKVIQALSYAKANVKDIEFKIQDSLSRRYFEEVYSQSEEYIEQQIEYAQARDDYYANHPEEWIAFERSENETTQELLIMDLTSCIFGFSAHSLSDLLEKADLNNPEILNFFLKEHVQQAIKKSRKNRRIVKEKLGTKSDIIKRCRKINAEIE